MKHSKRTGRPNYAHPTPRQSAAERAALIAQLGWTPEPKGCCPGDRYAATAGELKRWVRERFGRAIADNCSRIAGIEP